MKILSSFLIVTTSIVLIGCGEKEVAEKSQESGEFGADGKEVTKNYSYKHEITELNQDLTLVYVEDTCEIHHDSIAKAYMNAYMALGGCADSITYKLKMQPMAYSVMDLENNQFILKACFAVSPEQEIDTTFSTEKLYTGNILKTYYYGDYYTMDPAYAEMDEFMADNDLVANGARFEEYVDDPGMNPESMDSVLTVIWQPIK